MFDKDKSVLIVSNSAGLITDFLDNDCTIYRDKGYRIDCACNMNYLGRDSSSFFDKFKIKPYDIKFPIRSLNIADIIKSYNQLKKIIKNNKYNAVHCHSTIAAAICRECTKKEKAKVIYTSHGFPFYEGCQDKKAVFYKAVEKHFSKYTDTIITVCNEDFNNARNMCCEKVYKINGVGVDFKRFDIPNFGKNEYRRKLGLKEDRKYILSVGELNTNKNHRVIIEALSKLNNKKITYLICGRELTEIGKKEELEQLAKLHEVEVIFLGYRTDVPEICMCADIGAFPSYKEGLGLSGIEMLRAGIPIVASNRQGIKDYVKDGVTGYLCNPNDPDSFAEGINKTFLLKDAAETKKNCIKMAESYSKDAVLKNMKKIMQEILD